MSATPEIPSRIDADPALARYHRQMLLPGIGAEGQRRLGAAHAVIVGVGALGCAIADSLARAGVGTLTLVDRDVVELTNLQRQTLFTEADAAAGTPKAVAAAERLRAINSSITVRPIVADVTSANAERLLCVGPPPGVFLDGADNFETRYLLNDLSVKRRVPYVYGGAVGTRGMAAAFVPGSGPCLRCIFPNAPGPGVSPTCDTAGVLGPVIALVAAYQCAEAIKLLAGHPEAVSHAMIDADLWGGRTRAIDTSALKDPACPCCGERRFEYLSGGAGGDAASLCGQNAVQVTPAAACRGDTVNLELLKARLSPHATVTLTRHLVRAVLAAPSPGAPPIEITVFGDGRAIIKGTNKPDAARTIYARYIGA